MLYKISNLQYSIRMKEVEYSRAVNSGDQLNVDLNNAALTVLKEDLAATVKAFNTIPPPISDNSLKASKKIRWWQSFFNSRPTLNRKS